MIPLYAKSSAVLAAELFLYVCVFYSVSSPGS